MTKPSVDNVVGEHDDFWVALPTTEPRETMSIAAADFRNRRERIIPILLFVFVQKACRIDIMECLAHVGYCWRLGMQKSYTVRVVFSAHC
jgi:hypothetical protein